MKKFMKAIAFATVMCMLLSTVAFASGAALTDPATKTVTVTVTTATGTEPVSVVIVEAGNAITQGNILYINQAPAVDGEVTFTAIVADAVSAIDVYAGSATYANANQKAEKVATALPVVEESNEIVVALDGTVVIEPNIEEADGYNASTMGTAATDIGALVILPVSFENVSSVSQMMWALGIDTNDDGNADDYKYVAGDVSSLSLGSVTDGTVQLGLAFINGEKGADDSLNIVSASAVFLIEGADYYAATDADKEAIEDDKVTN